MARISIHLTVTIDTKAL